jgi:hypothetical protein
LVPLPSRGALRGDEVVVADDRDRNPIPLDHPASRVGLRDVDAVHAAQDVDPDWRRSQEYELVRSERPQAFDDRRRSPEPRQRGGDGPKIVVRRADEHIEIFRETRLGLDADGPPSNDEVLNVRI